MADLAKPTVVAVVGPTASGKTEFAILLAQALNGEIVSFDSMQLYRGMDIATAKPTSEELARAKHHMISVVDTDASYSVADYCKQAGAIVDDILSRGKLPVLVGGTGLYLDSFLSNLSFADEEGDPALREQLKTRSNEDLLAELRTLDPDYADKLHVADQKRIIRALEVIYKTGKTMTEQLRLSRQTPPKYHAVYFGLNYRNREVLYDRINRRVDQMVANGLVQEARDYLNTASSTSAQAIGHKELRPYLLGESDLAPCIEALKQATRRYAKRQLSWFHRNPDIHWLYKDECSQQQMLDTALSIFQKQGGSTI